ncbi:MAG TPA: presqualene diphosphate synthase HpnD [Candidatus Polarisedimenticolia bacterium]
MAFMNGTLAVGRRRASVGSSFHYSFGLLPRDQRRGIEAVYAFCRAVDDLADEGAVEPARAAALLRLHRDEIGRCYDGAPTLTVTRALQEWIRRFAIPRAPFDDLLDGVEMDLTTTRYAGFDDLKLYCYRVASTVGLICVAIFGCRDPRSPAYAVELGIALQLTNILRDIKSDAARGRIYLPADEMRAFGYSETELLAGRNTPAYLALMRHQVARAERQFEIAARSLPEEDRPRLVAAEVMGAIYRRLLRRIADDPGQVFEGRITVPRLTQVAVALRAWFTGHAGR